MGGSWSGSSFGQTCLAPIDMVKLAEKKPLSLSGPVRAPNPPSREVAAPSREQCIALSLLVVHCALDGAA